jgi:tetratricopeptide (TPR) repeat protein/DNA-binding winged helix-turn-helix (wHTH) protein
MSSPLRPEPPATAYRIDGILLDPARSCLVSEEREIHLRQKAFLVLQHLLQQRHRLVSKDELLDRIWADTAVTEDALVQCIVDVRRALGDNSREPRYVRTVPKRGYRFVGPVEELPWPPVVEPAPQAATLDIGPEGDGPSGPPATARQVAMETRTGGGRPTWPAVAAGLLILASGAWSILAPERPAAEVRLARDPGRRALAILPFENRSGAIGLEWLREGLADMLINDLARSPGVNVLSRHQTAALLERSGYGLAVPLPLDAALDVARRSDADAVVLGAYAGIGEKLRVDAAIHDVATGRLLATESLVLDRADTILTSVDLLSLRLARALGLSNRPPATPDFAAVMTSDLQAYRFYSLGLQKADALHNADAISLFEQAIARDPEFAMAHARIGYAYGLTWNFADKALPYLERAFKLQHRLTERDRLYISAWHAIIRLETGTAEDMLRAILRRYPDDPEPYVRLSRLLEGEDRLDEAIAVLKDGLVAHPDSPELFHALSNNLSVRGLHAEAIEAGRRYVALAPAEPNAYDALGLAYQWAGRYEEGIESYERALQLKPDFDLALVHLGNTYYQLGRYRQALAVFDRFVQAAQDREAARGHLSAALVELRLQDIRSAETRADLAVRLSPRALAGRFLVALERGDKATARRLAAALHDDIRLPARGGRANERHVAYREGRLAQLTGRIDAAGEAFRRAVATRPPTWDIDPMEDCLALWYLDTGKVDAAISELDRILAVNPRYPLARYHLGLAYEKKGRLEPARDAYAQFLVEWRGADPDIRELGDARARLQSVSHSRGPAPAGATGHPAPGA